MGRFIAFLLIVPLVFSSCTGRETPESLFREGEYKDSIALSDSILSSRLDEDALYYKAASCFSLGLSGEAEEAATLYLLLYSDGKHRNDALYIILFTDSDTIAVRAGEELMESGELSHRALLRLCFLYAHNDMDAEFSRMYRSIRISLSDAENAFLLIADGDDLSMIFMSFDKIIESGREIDEELLEAASALFGEKGKHDLFESYISSRGIAFPAVI